MTGTAKIVINISGGVYQGHHVEGDLDRPLEVELRDYDIKYADENSPAREVDTDGDEMEVVRLNVGPSDVRNSDSSLQPVRSVLMKLGRIARHAEGMLSPDGDDLDAAVIESLLTDPEVKAWMVKADLAEAERLIEEHRLSPRAAGGPSEVGNG